MNVELRQGRDLDAGLAATWEWLQAGNPELTSPYFTPEFCRIMSAVRDDVEVAVIRQNRDVVGIFPFQRAALGCPESH